MNHSEDTLIWEAFRQNHEVIEEMGQTGEETPVALLKQCRDMIARLIQDPSFVDDNKEYEASVLMGKIDALMNHSSVATDPKIWKQSVQGSPAADKMAGGEHSFGLGD